MKNQVSQLGTSIAHFVGENAVDIAATALTCAAGAGIAYAGAKAVTTTCLVGGALAATFVVYQAAKGAVVATMLAPKALGDMYARAREAMPQPKQAAA